VLPDALYSRGEEIARGLFGSFTLGVGQFCTKPGLIFLPRDVTGNIFVDELKAQVEKAAAAAMLTEGIAKSYRSGVAKRQSNAETVAQASADGAGSTYSAPIVMQIGARELLGEPELATEIFGPSALVIRYDSREELLELARSLEGQLTATLHGSERDLEAFADLIAILERKAGRLIVNGFPTGVEVCHAMVHGGPYPATSDSRATSVGTYSINRFARPVCYQDFPGSALPDELKNQNPLGIWRLIDGEFTRDVVSAGSKAGTA
jgi:NADP-dependent aldehyde dehydrogenase